MSLSSANRSLQLVLRLVDPRTAMEPMIDPMPPKPELPAVSSLQQLPRHRPEMHGIPSRHIAAFLQELKQDPTLRMHGIMIVRDGCVVCEAAFDEQELNRPRMTFSACKSTTAMAIGILMDDGLLTPDDRITELFPKEGNLVNRQLLKNITVSDLLSMQTGNQFNELSCMTEDDWLRGFFASPALRGKFNYNSVNTYILSRIVCQLSGMSMSQFLKIRLFEPMGIENYYWEVCPKGFEKGGWGLYMRAEDLAKLGQLVQNGGCWNGKQLISESFLTLATSTQAEAPKEFGDFNYGWQFWVGRTEHTVLFNGMLGQNVLCFKDTGITLVSHAANDETFQQSNYFTLAARYFGGSFDAKLPQDLLAQWQLKKVIRSLAAPAGKLPSKAEFSRFAGKRFAPLSANAASCGLLPLTLQAVQNYYSTGLRKLSIGGSRNCVEIRYEEGHNVYQFTAGTKKPIIQNLTFGGNVFRVAAQARFTHNDEEQPVLRLQLSFLETPFTRILKLVITPHGVLLQQSETPCMDQILNTALSSSRPALSSLIGTVFGTGDLEFLRWKMALVFAPKVELEES